MSAIHAQLERRREPRGNTIVLVVAVLALLVIIATGFVTRTQTGRTTAIATRDGKFANHNVGIIADMIAEEIGSALFPRPVDRFDPCLTSIPPCFVSGAADGNYRRLDPPINLIPRYGIDVQTDPLDPTLLPYTYNFAPYEVVPWTNWPDGLGNFTTDGRIPPGPGNPNGGTTAPIYQTEFNPVGNPGFGDTRWLADSEPLSVDLDGNGQPDRYTHWRKISNLSRPNNGWRVCRDIANLVIDLNNDGLLETPNVVTDLNVPIEQWLTVVPDTVTTTNFDDAEFFGGADFENRWLRWMPGPGVLTPTGLPNYLTAYADPALIPSNFYRLIELNDNNVPLENFERASAETQAGTARWWISRVLTDTDGDGHTDAFWHQVPTPSERGIRQIVAVRVVDNSSMLNINAATRFKRVDDNEFGLKTKGHTPADLQLIGDLGDPRYALGLQVGMFDNRDNWETDIIWPGFYEPYGESTTRWSLSRWDEFLFALGVLGPNDNALTALTRLTPQSERLLYWQLVGRQPLDPDFLNPVASPFPDALTPFGLSEEIELRLFNASNHAWIETRLETAMRHVQGGDPNNDWDLLHSGGHGGSQDDPPRVEVSEVADQLRNRELVHDVRSRLTTYSGARQDLAPAWLWYSDDRLNGGTLVDLSFQRDRRRKFDLRAPMWLRDFNHNVDLTGDGVLDIQDTELGYRQLFADTFYRALSDQSSFDEPNRDTYFGDGVNTDEAARNAAASMAANALAYRDEDLLPLPVTEAIVGYNSSQTQASGFTGLEPQPFFMEAFLGHVHEAQVIPPAHVPPTGGPIPYGDAGQLVIFNDANLHSTAVAVQLGNPFDVPIQLNQFVVRLYDQTFDLGNLPFTMQFLPPTTPETPYTLVLYGLDDVNGSSLEAPFRDFFDIENADHTDAAGINYLMAQGVPATTWSASRSAYDTNSGAAFELLRKDPVDPFNSSLWVVVDRFDDPDEPADSFDNAVDTLGQGAPVDPMPVPLESAVITVPGDPYPQGVNVGANNGTHWMEWVRVTRAWGADLNLDGFYAPNERNPRYVSGAQAVVIVDENDTTGGSTFTLTQAPDTPWFNRQYFQMNGTQAARKPTFFNFDNVFDDGYPDKGWYTQLASTAPMQLGGPDVSPDTINGVLMDFPMQMLLKNGDFEQVGELLNVWMWGHELNLNVTEQPPNSERFRVSLGNPLDTGQPGGTTRTTFSEFLAEAVATSGLDRGGTGPRTGRLDPMRDDSIIEGDDSVPDLPAASRVLEAFVCDGPGELRDFDNSGVIGDQPDLDIHATRWFLNANGYTGQITPARVNINTASRQVLRTLPHWYSLIHETEEPALNPPVRLAEAAIRYRERLGDPSDTNDVFPAYGDRGRALTSVPNSGYMVGMRGARGFASVGELMLLQRGGKLGKVAGGVNDVTMYLPQNNNMVARDNMLFNGSYRIDAPMVPERELFEQDTGIIHADTYIWNFNAPNGQIAPRNAQVSVDAVDPRDPLTNYVDPLPDVVAEDSEEGSMLYGGASNMVTTTSDTFTVYFRVRSVRQNPVTGGWDATDPDSIVDDGRYVMLVDRSSVTRPGDEPKILYLEKITE